MSKLKFLMIFFLSICSAQEINFSKLIGNGDSNNYYIGHFPVVGSDGLEIKWFGGIKLKEGHSGNVIRMTNGNVGIGTEAPTEKLEINGSLKINNQGAHSSIILGQESNDRIIVDNTNEKYYGGGYFFRVHNNSLTHQYIDALLISETGNVAISNKLEAREIKVTESPTADFVFEENYNLPSLQQVENHIKEKKHLPEIPSAKEMEKDGVNIGEFQIKLLQKIEELTLYIIEQNKENKRLEKRISELENNK